MRPWQLGIASTTRHSLFPSEALRLRAVLNIVRIFRDVLVMFCVVDDHVHVIVICDERDCWVHARSFKLSMAAVAAVPTKPVHIEPVHGRNHMESVHRYVLRQPSHHGLPGHQALWTGSCFPDLVGARWIPNLDLRIADVLPRYGAEHACRKVGLSIQDLAPLPLDEVRSAGPRALALASAAACASDPATKSKNAQSVLARRVACTLARQSGMPTKEIAWALDLHPSNARKLVAKPPPTSALLAARRRLALERAAATTT